MNIINEYLEQILFFAYISCIAFFTASGSFFLQYTFREGAIFGRYLPILARLILRFTDKRKYKSIPNTRGHDNTFIMEAYNTAAYKILGGCGVCSNIWQSFIVYLFVFGVEKKWYICLIFLLISNLFYRKIDK